MRALLVGARGDGDGVVAFDEVLGSRDAVGDGEVAAEGEDDDGEEQGANAHAAGCDVAGGLGAPQFAEGAGDADQEPGGDDEPEPAGRGRPDEPLRTEVV